MTGISAKNKHTTQKAFDELCNSVKSALKTYANVHRGSGHFSQITTKLYEQARKEVLEYIDPEYKNSEVIFCSPINAGFICSDIDKKNYLLLSSEDLGLAIGVRALLIKKKFLPNGAPGLCGGGTTRLISRDWILWSTGIDKFEAGTPAVINIICFAKALQLSKKYGNSVFLDQNNQLNVVKTDKDNELTHLSGADLLGKLKSTLIGNQEKVPTALGSSEYINFDNSASTQTYEPIWHAFQDTINLSSENRSQVVDMTKSTLASFLNAPAEVYSPLFTGNTTEAINLAALNLKEGLDDIEEPVIVNTLLEHSSNDLPWRMLPDATVLRLDIDDEGFINLDDLWNLLNDYNEKKVHGNKRIKMVAISGASNVLGSCNNIQEISGLSHQYGAKVLVDAAQLVAHKQIDMEADDIDFLAFSAHKIYAPFGTGVLIAKSEHINFKPDYFSELNKLGEENIAGIAALNKSLELLQSIGLELIHKEEQKLGEYLLNGLNAIPGIKLYGVQSPLSENFKNKLGVVVFTFEKQMANSISKKLANSYGIGSRYGCLCSHIIIKDILGVSPGLEKFQKLMLTLLPKVQLPGVTRVSLGLNNTKSEIDALIDALKLIQSNKLNQSNGTFKTQMKNYTSEMKTMVFS